MKENILITGGTGLVGTYLSKLLLAQGYSVSYLSRRKKSLDKIEVYQWNINKQEIEIEALEKADYIIHLAGAGVVDESWSDERKKIILDSRVMSTRLLYNKLKEQKIHPKAFVSASAIGIYGWDTGDKLISEESPHGAGYLADVTKAWEEEIKKIQTLDIPTSWVRVGIVLSDKGGALVKMAQPVRLFAGAPLASGKQYLSWIHIKDLSKMFVYLLENKLTGPYNGVAPHPQTNKNLTKAIGKVLDKPVFLPNVPSFVLKMMLGERADMIIGGNNVSSNKITTNGFTFEFENLSKALKDLIG